ncbi:hypothetical protein NDU88_006789 [Pleurodeles waltl]|uniref:Uncharacterized protein n=1 Tax=Pleurodeles waltl TaxID=8319 RepID=A0AAV7SQP3_PLEWA|nr:hypothetical protein NDU88_006789 [Pleurodeles waltl]
MPRSRRSKAVIKSEDGLLKRCISSASTIRSSALWRYAKIPPPLRQRARAGTCSRDSFQGVPRIPGLCSSPTKKALLEMTVNSGAKTEDSLVLTRSHYRFGCDQSTRLTK